MARNALLGIVLLASLALGGCSAGEDQAAAAEAQLARMRTRNDSLRSVRDARSTLAATTRGVDSLPGVSDGALADSLRKAREIEVMRETFAYTGSTRDPFNSLINMASAGPEIGDLEVVGIYQDLRSASNSIVVLREKVSLKRHKLRVGDQVGRARLVQIRPRDAVFTIQDFGYERQETLSLRKQEVETP
ncbi:MAG: hypothetical protein H0T68_04805 [Gemmatimonadales bacterium]|nr:hypothetical protein [Gemmatimonadales bacterium]